MIFQWSKNYFALFLLLWLILQRINLSWFWNSAFLTVHADNLSLYLCATKTCNIFAQKLNWKMAATAAEKNVTCHKNICAHKLKRALKLKENILCLHSLELFSKQCSWLNDVCEASHQIKCLQLNISFKNVTFFLYFWNETMKFLQKLEAKFNARFEQTFFFFEILHESFANWY